MVDYSGRSSENILLSGYVYPPFWLTWWFIGIIVVLFLVVVVFIFKLQLKKRQRKLEQQNELNASKLTAIKLQMNPHFIFNVLNSIKSYIYENDRRKATEYLEDFSDLIRRTLDMSDLQYVSLEEEIQLIKLYIELEAMMLSPDFSYSVEIDEQIDVYGMRVPALLLQPHIENAFKHGLRHKAGEKRLVVSLFYVNSTTIRIEVTDNGIGRAAAEEINKMNTHKHKSFATNAIEKRISLINSHGIQKIHLETIDLFDDSTNPTGTKIVIEIE